MSKKSKDSLKRKLTTEEITDICNVIELNKTHDKEIANCLRANVINNIKKQLYNIQIYPQAIPLLKKQIKQSYETSFVHPGEGVGCTAASSIGEQNTQASLNSFHSSGLGKINLTLGVPRLKELLNASKVMKTPSCKVYLKKEAGDLTDLYTINQFCNRELIYHDVKSIIKNVSVDCNPVLSDFDKKYYSFFKTFYSDINTECKWRISIYFCLETLFKIQKTLMYITGCIKSTLNLCDESISIIFFPDTIGRIDIWVIDNIDQPSTIIKKKYSKVIETDEEKEITMMINDDNKIYFLIRDIILPLIHECHVSGIYGIEKCYYNEEKNGEWSIDTKGTNYKDIMNHDLVDSTKTTSNNVWDVYHFFGIDAAKNFLEEEFSKIINVSKRHLDLLTANMTTIGKISSVSRYGIDRKQVGPLAKICFEQPFDNSIQAALYGEKDKLLGASSTIALGKQINSGTGMVKLLLDTEMINRCINPRENSLKDFKLDHKQLLDSCKNNCEKESVVEEDEFDLIY